jgi:polysaccharide export outer membrane protein
MAVARPYPLTFVNPNKKVIIQKLVPSAFLLCALQVADLQSVLYGQTRPPASTASNTPPAPVTAPASNAAPSSNAGLPPLYVIQPNDLLSVFVWKEPTLSGKVLVRPDGRISLPLVQDMQAAGLNPGELKQKIEENLKQYLEVPNVTVVVESIQSYRIFVTGRVGKPGALMAEKPLNVLQALALSGGFSEFANPDEIVIVRNNGTDNTLLRFNYREVIKGRNFDQNLMLRSGDVVVVP